MTDNTADKLWLIGCGIAVVVVALTFSIPDEIPFAEISIVKLVLIGTGLVAGVVLLCIHNAHYGSRLD